jgi:hypothetical protein
MVGFRWVLMSGLSLALLSACERPEPASNASVAPTTAAASAGVTIVGKLVSADGQTPVSGGLVYVEGATSLDAAQSACGVPPEKNWVSTCSSTDGSFRLNVSSELPPSAKLILVKDGVRLEQVFLAESRGTVDAGVVMLTPDPAAVSARTETSVNPG